MPDRRQDSQHAVRPGKPISQAAELSWGQENGGQWQGKFYPTDKINNGMLPHYERILGRLRDQPVRVLDIGIAMGGSCLLWSDYFSNPDSRITGLDIRLPPRIMTYDWSKIVLKICDQNDRKRLNEIATQFGPFDVIVDDGCHRYTETQTCYQELYKHLKPGGYYIIEDWSVGYWKDPEGTYRGAHGETMVGLVVDIIRDGTASGLVSCQVIHGGYTLAFFEKSNSSTPVRTEVSFRCLAPVQDAWPIVVSGKNRASVSAIVALLRCGHLLLWLSTVLNLMWAKGKKDP